MPKPSTLTLSIGTNLPDDFLSKLKNMRKAFSEISKIASIERYSSIYLTSPLEITNQPSFLNACLEIEFDSSQPIERFFMKLKSIEKNMGRVFGLRYGPRVIDIDIIFWDENKKNSELLTIPHPKWSERHFVTIPLVDLNTSRNCKPPYNIAPSMKISQDVTRVAFF